MRNLILYLFILLGMGLSFKPIAQTSQNTLIESGKILVELVKIFKKSNGQPAGMFNTNNLSDLCFANSSLDNLFIEISKKINDSFYKPLPASISLNSQSHECLLELISGIYHYKLFKRNGTSLTLQLEGDLKLVPNEKMEREIK